MQPDTKSTVLTQFLPRKQATNPSSNTPVCLWAQVSPTTGVTAQVSASAGVMTGGAVATCGYTTHELGLSLYCCTVRYWEVFESPRVYTSKRMSPNIGQPYSGQAPSAAAGWAGQYRFPVGAPRYSGPHYSGYQQPKGKEFLR
ncbi:Hypp5434 [Branchiostoma lanceolatum]|uniref:Hypp5434 protein n=1 Tax=Branchiostoma lanceolatum TaxID=7740 RepID=A0A8J9YRT5_BRALA|nr:Hypp5434 [Branchiostoma lanceolatum]